MLRRLGRNIKLAALAFSVSVVTYWIAFFMSEPRSVVEVVYSIPGYVGIVGLLGSILAMGSLLGGDPAFDIAVVSYGLILTSVISSGAAVLILAWRDPDTSLTPEADSA